jgi:hypothetical protein
LNFAVIIGSYWIATFNHCKVKTRRGGRNRAVNRASNRRQVSRLFAGFVAGAVLAVFAGPGAGCVSSTESRIKKNQELFDSLPAQAQEGVRAGRVEVGYTPDMVLLALGQPDRRYMRATESGSSEVWAYASKAPALSLGLGIGIGGRAGRGVGVNSGISVATGGDRTDDRARVVFEGGRVIAVERASR